MSWLSNTLNLTEKEKIIQKLEDACGLSDEPCTGLKKLKLPELQKLHEEIEKALDLAFKQGQMNVQEALNRPG